MPDGTLIVAGEAPDGVRLTMSTRDDRAVIETTLSHRAALRLALDVLQLVSRPHHRWIDAPADQAPLLSTLCAQGGPGGQAEG